MEAKDVMTTNVVAVSPDTVVQEIAGLLLEHKISGVPVVDGDQHVVGVVSEGDLMRRAESQTERSRSWWLDTFLSTEEKAADFVKTHGMKASDVMTRDVVSVSEETPVHEIAGLLEKRHVKRVPVVRNGQLVGIVSRANLLHGLACKGGGTLAPGTADDRAIRETLLHTLSDDAGINTARINVMVDDGIVQLWGLIESVSQKKAAQIAAENTPGVKAVENHLGRVPGWVSAN